MTTAEVKRLIENGIPGAIAVVVDTTGTGDHFRAQVTATQFANLSAVAQHRMVFATLVDVMSGDHAPLHALDLKTHRP